MSALAATLEAYFADRLIGQRHASPHTVAAYRDSWRLLLRFMRDRTGKEPSELDLADLDAPAVGAFLDHLEHERHNSARTRNARLAAIRSFFHYAALRHPEHAGLIARVLAIPAKRCDRTEVCYLTRPELDALVAAPDRTSWTGRRDHALLDLAIQTGLRVSELTGLRNQDIKLGAGAHARCMGKGRKERATPLSKQSVAVLRAWTQERGGDPADPLFPTRQGTSLSRGAVEDLVAKHATTATRRCPSLGTKHPTPHVLRHSCAMELRLAGSTRRSSLCGSAMRPPRPPAGSTSTPTSRSRSEPSPAQRHYTPSPGATGQGTGSSPSSTACNYAVRIPSDSATLPRSTVPRPIMPAPA
jgi:integrase/recombinase XerD